MSKGFFKFVNWMHMLTNGIFRSSTFILQYPVCIVTSLITVLSPWIPLVSHICHPNICCELSLVYMPELFQVTLVIKEYPEYIPIMVPQYMYTCYLLDICHCIQSFATALKYSHKLTYRPWLTVLGPKPFTKWYNNVHFISRYLQSMASVPMNKFKLTVRYIVKPCDWTH